MEPKIETWDDGMVTHYHVALPGSWIVRQRGKWGLTKMVIKLIWGIGAVKRTPPPSREK